MNTDAFFTIGKTHAVCQDYALAGSHKVALSDGCSSSPHTDFGSRILCQLATRHPPDRVASLALPLLEELALPREAMDATLLAAEYDPAQQGVKVTVQGDGVVLVRDRKGQCTYFCFRFESGAPLYPSYFVMPSRYERYMQEFGDTASLIISGNEYPLVDPVQGVWTLFFPEEEFDLVLLFSDGVESFRRTSPNGQVEVLPLDEVLAEMSAIKGFVGEFLSRRAKRALKNFATQGWHHDDDFSVAGIYCP